ncbi:MAG: hypothetical protein LRZ88_06710 [Candidatus Cloacimonetes bacterium]|nr:hypothetical protein [Candidatus Cloacimonadota bacterium]
MKKLILPILALLFILPIFAQNAERITGVWFNGEKTSKIEISQAEDGSFIGNIVWLKRTQRCPGQSQNRFQKPG